MEELQDLEKQKIPHPWKNYKISKNKKYHNLGRITRSRKTKNTTSLEELQDLEKQKNTKYQTNDFY